MTIDDNHIYACILIKCELRPETGDEAYVDIVTRHLANNPYIGFISVMTGEYDVMAIASTRTTEDLWQLVVSQIQRMDGVLDTVTLVYFSKLTFQGLSRFPQHITSDEYDDTASIFGPIIACILVKIGDNGDQLVDTAADILKRERQALEQYQAKYPNATHKPFGIIDIAACAGSYDFTIFIQAQNNPRLGELVDIIRQSSAVSRTVTMVSLSEMRLLNWLQKKDQDDITEQ